MLDHKPTIGEPIVSSRGAQGGSASHAYRVTRVLPAQPHYWITSADELFQRAAPAALAGGEWRQVVLAQQAPPRRHTLERPRPEELSDATDCARWENEGGTSGPEPTWQDPRWREVLLRCGGPVGPSSRRTK